VVLIFFLVVMSGFDPNFSGLSCDFKLLIHRFTAGQEERAVKGRCRTHKRRRKSMVVYQLRRKSMGGCSSLLN